jgi:hypothetical protein
VKKVKLKIKNAEWTRDGATRHDGRAALPRRPNFHKNNLGEILPCFTARLAALAGGEIRAEQQLCPTTMLRATSVVQPGCLHSTF